MHFCQFLISTHLIGSSELPPNMVLQIYVTSLNLVSLKQDFELLDKVRANRVRTQQLKILHKTSQIQCVLQFESNSTVNRSSEIIHKYMTFNPVCKQLAAYIKALLIVINDITSLNGLPPLQLNTYIISVLVIFYLQLKHKMPTINALTAMLSDQISFTSRENLNEFIKEFFNFYGHTYQITVHLICLNVGRWQDKQPQKHQKHFSPQQKRCIFMNIRNDN